MLQQPPLNPAERRSKRRGSIQPTRPAGEPNLLESPTALPTSASQPISPEPIPVEPVSNSGPDLFSTQSNPRPTPQTIPQSNPQPSAPVINRWASPPAGTSNVSTVNIWTLAVDLLREFSPMRPKPSPQDVQPLQEPASFPPTSPVMPGQVPVRRLAPERMNANDAAPVRGMTSGVSLEWSAPKAMNLGQEATCQLICRNSATTTTTDVCVTLQLPSTVERGRCEPMPEDDGARLTWRLGKMPRGRLAHTPFMSD